MDTTTQGVRLNNAQRKALVEIVARRFDERIDAARQTEKELEKQITVEIAKKFGLSAINAELERLDRQMDNLRDRRKELGFDDRYDGTGKTWYIQGGRAKLLLEAKIKNRSLAVRRLSELRTRTEQQVWLAATVGDAEQLLRRVDVMPGEGVV
jgi:hypothetical protein